MKQEWLKEIKRLKNKYIQSKNSFEIQRLYFNMKVKDEIRIQKLENITEVKGYDHYENAQFIMEILQEAFEEIAFQNPNYSKEEIKKVLLEEKELEIFEQEYELYKNCGYFNVREKEKYFESVKEEVTEKMKDAGSHSKKKVSEQLSKIGTTAVKIVKPYGEVAKGQLEEVGIFAKKTVNKGSKKLIKTLQNVADKTEN